ncbi:dihydrolipoyl dehydrogenase family protein [Celeribacter neptunius]|uniref:Pyruvate/2-oxoglutarate dehydrogenase complex, dihydrolipoamide dehydrogenase (E3) component n=1 Tax=Celeribacter neptunius TaxID=588602 RepID=A0A1I3RDD4_9RHOB|nr:FAD-dependent oxidoreductase [Celeribacter neptunius]SFJ43689.1 Pyruvate/2-oxoglutarate dehydrogenase complex, dihydrolipoamide dehydrogenase (E3) component [Celeribacter neptunius]
MTKAKTASPKRIKTDICVIGAGSGGLSVAAGAVQMGARVVLIEKGEMGGDCLNTGCVPSKALLHAAQEGLSYPHAMEHVRKTISTIAPHDSQERFEGLGCTVIRAEARFTSPKSVEAGGIKIKARRFVIATGSRPMLLDIPGLSTVPYLTNETIWGLTGCPRHLIILGGGPIGMEMAQAHRRLGAEVTVIEAFDALGREDPEAAELVKATLRAEGVALREGVAAERISGAAGAIQVTLSDGQVVQGSHLLAATGRRANSEELGLEHADVDRSKNGIKVGADLRTSNRRIYAIGDVVSGGLQFTHVAGYQAGIIVRSLLFALPAKARTHHIPHATYTDPELAQVGLTEAAAREKFAEKLEVVRADYTGNDRAIATGRGGAGFIKLMVVKGRPVGVTIVGPEAGELIAFWSLMLSLKLKMSKIAGMVAPYPTLAELNKRAVSAYFTPRLFENRKVKWVVKAVQRLVP